LLLLLLHRVEGNTGVNQLQMAQPTRYSLWCVQNLSCYEFNAPEVGN